MFDPTCGGGVFGGDYGGFGGGGGIGIVYFPEMYVL
jgi:hypothetical protein